jgi:hypothetical protein
MVDTLDRLLPLAEDGSLTRGSFSTRRNSSS